MKSQFKKLGMERLLLRLKLEILFLGKYNFPNISSDFPKLILNLMENMFFTKFPKS
jgi:hypothetical protein